MVSSVFQKDETSIEVNESGSEAAAATDMCIDLCYLEPDPKFICKKPFMVFIKDGLTGLVLFAGSVNNPARH